MTQNNFFTKRVAEFEEMSKDQLKEYVAVIAAQNQIALIRPSDSTFYYLEKLANTLYQNDQFEEAIMIL